MYARTTLLTLLLSAGLLSARQEKAEWTDYSSEVGKCSVKFPGKPKENAAADMAQALLETRNGTAVYLLQVNKFPMAVDAEKAEVANPILDSTRDALAKALPGGKVLSEKKATFQKKYPERDIDVDAPGLGIYRVRVILTPTHLYQVTLAGPKEFVDSADAKTFRESFKLK